MRRRVDKELWIYLLGAGPALVAERGHVDRAPQNLIQHAPCINQSIQPGGQGWQLRHGRYQSAWPLH